jgi:uncharacterized alkaline shock family protein YloU
MKIPLEKGTLHISTDVFKSISGYAANYCFGVKGMASRSVQDGIVQLLRRENLSKGVKVVCSPDGKAVDITLHIVVEHGINIPETCRSMIHEVRYNVEKITGAKVGTVNICVDSIVVE